MLLRLYHHITNIADIPLTLLLKQRLAQGKEDPARWQEKKGIPSRQRPDSALIWLHAASVGEAQSALILIEKITAVRPDVHMLVTSGTLTSSQLLSSRLPEQAFHQFLPLDHPQWVRAFLDYWHPDLVLWMESELWPNFLNSLKERNIPALLLNARLSKKSLQNWKKAPAAAHSILSAFSLILCQTAKDEAAYRDLGAKDVQTTGNIKYSAAPLPFIPSKLDALKTAIASRPLWVYASTHEGEEEIALRLHQKLKKVHPDLLTIIIPRHPNRGSKIEQDLRAQDVRIQRRTDAHNLPTSDTDIYIADTLGELGLFYRLTPIAVIGRSLSIDGGGGHNPIEAAQLDCVVLHGPHVQNLADIYHDMHMANACLQIKDENHFYEQLNELLNTPQKRHTYQQNAKQFCDQQTHQLQLLWERLEPYILATAKDVT